MGNVCHLFQYSVPPFLSSMYLWLIYIYIFMVFHKSWIMFIVHAFFFFFSDWIILINQCSNFPTFCLSAQSTVSHLLWISHFICNSQFWNFYLVLFYNLHLIIDILLIGRPISLWLFDHGFLLKHIKINWFKICV